jgi:hypothetical protein
MTTGEGRTVVETDAVVVVVVRSIEPANWSRTEGVMSLPSQLQCKSITFGEGLKSTSDKILSMKRLSHRKYGSHFEGQRSYHNYYYLECAQKTGGVEY